MMVTHIYNENIVTNVKQRTPYVNDCQVNDQLGMLRMITQTEKKSSAPIRGQRQEKLINL